MFIMRARYSGKVQFPCSCCNLVVKTEQILINITDKKNFFWCRIVSTALALASIRVGNENQANTYTYLWVLHLVPSSSLVVMLYGEGHWPNPYPLPFLILFSKVYFPLVGFPSISGWVDAELVLPRSTPFICLPRHVSLHCVLVLSHGLDGWSASYSLFPQLPRTSKEYTSSQRGEKDGEKEVRKANEEV